MHATAALYLDLMKRILTNIIYEDPNISPRQPLFYVRQLRENGEDWPLIAHTMIGMKRLDNLQYCVEKVIAENIPGDLIETGVWRGGAAIFMRAILKAYGVTDRRVLVAIRLRGFLHRIPCNFHKMPMTITMRTPIWRSPWRKSG